MSPEALQARGERGVPARVTALRALQRVHERGAWSAQAVDRELRHARLDARDRAFAANLAYETLRWQGTLDWALARVSSRPLDAVDPVILDALRLGAWQLLRGRIPDRAAVDTTVEAVRATAGPKATGFANGVLRTLARTQHTLPWPSERSDEGLGLALGYPAWVVREARARFGEDRSRAVLQAGNAPPGVTLRVTGSPVEAARAALLEELAAQGLHPHPGTLAPEAVRVPGADPARLAAVADGRAVVQDEASMVVARAVLGEPVAGDHGRPLVLDACAGPGGKSTHLAQLGARVVATEAVHARSRLVARAAELLGGDRGGERVHVATADATAPPLRPESFDAVLVDAPCTGLGVVRRRPELRWRRGPEDPVRLADLQLAILQRAADLVRPGGRLVYAACTWTVAETVDVAERLVAVADDRLVVEEPVKGNAMGKAQLGGMGTQLAPDRDDTDGMYVLVLRRRGGPPGAARAGSAERRVSRR